MTATASSWTTSNTDMTLTQAMDHIDGRSRSAFDGRILTHRWSVRDAQAAYIVLRALRGYVQVNRARAEMDA